MDANEALALQCVYGESTILLKAFHFQKQHNDQKGGMEGFEAHMGAPHFQDWGAFAGKDVVGKPPVVSSFNTM